MVMVAARIRRLALSLVLIVAASLLPQVTPAAVASHVSSGTSVLGDFHPLNPVRGLNTQLDAASCPSRHPCQKIPAGTTLTWNVAGAYGVPVGAIAVALNVTVLDATQASYVTFFPADASPPETSNLTVAAGQQVTHAVTSMLSSDGMVKIFNAAGEVHVLADVQGYYSRGGGTAGDRFTAISPQRVMDTRDGTGVCDNGCSAIGPTGTLTATIAGRPGVPVGATAVAVNVTVAGPTAGGYVTLYPSGSTPQGTRAVTFAAGGTVSNLVTVQLGPDGRVKIFNLSGWTHVILDVAGYYRADLGGLYRPLQPERILDTRSGIGNCGASTCQPPGPSTPNPMLVKVGGSGGIPPNGATAAMLNVTITGATATSALTVWPSGSPRPALPNLNFSAGQTLSAQVAVTLPLDGWVAIYNSAGQVEVIADVVGWFGAEDKLAPSPPLGVVASGALTPDGKPEITVSWQPSKNATSYLVLRRERASGGEYTFVGVSTILSYVDRQVSRDVSYFYTVSAINGAQTRSMNSLQAHAVVGTAPSNARPTAYQMAGTTAAPGLFNEAEMLDQLRRLDAFARSKGYSGPTLVDTTFEEMRKIDPTAKEPRRPRPKILNSVVGGTFACLINGALLMGRLNNPKAESTNRAVTYTTGGAMCFVSFADVMAKYYLEDAPIKNTKAWQAGVTCIAGFFARTFLAWGQNMTTYAPGINPLTQGLAGCFGGVAGSKFIGWPTPYPTDWGDYFEGAGRALLAGLPGTLATEALYALSRHNQKTNMCGDLVELYDGPGVTADVTAGITEGIVYAFLGTLATYVTVTQVPPDWDRTINDDASITGDPTGGGDDVFKFSAGWSYRTGVAGAHGGDEHFTDQPGASYSIDFVGGRIRLITSKGPDRGHVQVAIDGQAVVKNFFDSYASKLSPNQDVFDSGPLEEKRHRLTVTVLGTKNESSSGFNVIADRVMIASKNRPPTYLVPAKYTPRDSLTPDIANVNCSPAGKPQTIPVPTRDYFWHYYYDPKISDISHAFYDPANWLPEKRVVLDPDTKVPYANGQPVHTGNYISTWRPKMALGWGLNLWGQAGTNTHLEREKRPKAIIGEFNGVTNPLNGVIQLGGGDRHSMALTADGQVWAWGTNAKGELGQGTTCAEKYVGYGCVGSTAALRVKNVPSTALRTSSTETVSAYLTGKKIAVGPRPPNDNDAGHSLVLRADGTVAAWGDNSRGQLGNGVRDDKPHPNPELVLSGSGGVPLSGIIDVQAGSGFSVALASDGSVYVWGGNEHGQLGFDSPTFVQTLPRKVATPAGWPITKISVAHSHILAFSKGYVLAWGDNFFGQLGNGTYTDRAQPDWTYRADGSLLYLGYTGDISAGESFSLALSTVGGQGGVYAWGGNSEGQLGLGHTTDRLRPTRLTTLPHTVPNAAGTPYVNKIAAGHYHAMATTSDGVAWVWGENDDGELGFGTTDINPHPTPMVNNELFGVTDIMGACQGKYALIPGPAETAAFQSLSPARLLDTRPGTRTIDGEGAGTGALSPGGQVTLQVTGRGGVPAAGVKAVMLNVTVTQPTTSGYLTVYPKGEPLPNASSSNFAAGQTVANLVVAKVGAAGQVSIFNGVGTTHVVADVTGWFPSDAAFTPLNPARLMDNRAGSSTIDGRNVGAGPTGPATIQTLQVAGRGGVPATNVGAVVLTVTALGSTAGSYITAWPSSDSRPSTSNLNMQNGNPVTNLVVVPVGSDGQIKLYNDAGSTHLIVDVNGWFPADSSYQPLAPARLWDTRAPAPADSPSTGEGPVQPGTTRKLKVTGRGGVPASWVGSVMVNITAVAPAAAGYLTVFPTGAPRPLASTINFSAGQVIANMAVAKVGEGGEISVYLPPEGGSTHLIVDVVGWFPS